MSGFFRNTVYMTLTTDRFASWKRSNSHVSATNQLRSTSYFWLLLEAHWVGE